MKGFVMACATAGMLLAHAAWGAEEATEIPTAGMTSTTSITATVEKIDMDSRKVTLKGPEGTTETITVGPEAYNLDQVEVGDRVTIEYTQALVMSLTPATGGEEERGEIAALERAPLGEKPAGVASRLVEVTATIEAIDAETREVTLKGPEQTLTFNVSEDVDLNKVKVGDQVLATYAEQLAVSVQPAEEPAKE